MDELNYMDIISIIALVGIIYTCMNIKKHFSLFSENKRLIRVYAYLLLFWLTLLLGALLSFKLFYFISAVFITLHISLRSRSTKESLAELQQMLKEHEIRSPNEELTLNTSKEDGPKNLSEAIQAGDLNKMAYFLDNGFNIEENDNGYTPLMKSIQNENMELVQYLIEFGANIHAKETGEREEWAMSPVILSSLHGLKDLTEYLLQNSADAEYFWTDSGNIVDLVKESGDHVMVSLLEEYGVTSLVNRS